MFLSAGMVIEVRGGLEGSKTSAKDETPGE